MLYRLDIITHMGGKIKIPVTKLTCTTLSKTRGRNQLNITGKTTDLRGLSPEDSCVALMLFVAKQGQMFVKFEVSLASLVAKVPSKTLPHLKLDEL